MNLKFCSSFFNKVNIYIKYRTFKVNNRLITFVVVLRMRRDIRSNITKLCFFKHSGRIFSDLVYYEKNSNLVNLCNFYACV